MHTDASICRRRARNRGRVSHVDDGLSLVLIVLSFLCLRRACLITRGIPYRLPKDLVAWGNEAAEVEWRTSPHPLTPPGAPHLGRPGDQR